MTASTLTQNEEQLAAWLKDAAARPWNPPANDSHTESSAQEMLSYLEERLRTSLRSRVEIDAYLARLSAEQAARQKSRARRGMVRGAVLLSALAASFLHYYYWDIQLRIATLPAPFVVVPVSVPPMAGDRQVKT